MIGRRSLRREAGMRAERSKINLCYALEFAGS
jgi:hypothetical protein